jgi:hypothetical protein
LVFCALLVALALAAQSLIPVAYAAEGDETCRACHTGAARDFDLSTMSTHLSCIDCHSTRHNGPGTGDPVMPSPRTCEGCHADEVEHFNAGKHFYGWEAMEAVPTFSQMPAAVTDEGCVVCHKVGYVWEDGSRGRCDSCHSRHKFSAEEASKPEACGTCHAGDHPHYKMWAESKHGMIYAIEGDTGRAPTCVTCHGSHEVLTAWGFLGLREGNEEDAEWAAARAAVRQTLETMGPARAPEVMRGSYEEWERVREQMVDRCTQCHAESYARRELEKGDALLREADLAQQKVIELANTFYEEGLIDDRTRFNLYRDSTAHRFSAYMGGFHNSPEHAWDEGYLALVSGLVAERDQAVQTKMLSMIRGKMGQLIPLAIAGAVGLVVALVGAGLLVWLWRRSSKLQAE